MYMRNHSKSSVRSVDAFGRKAHFCKLRVTFKELFYNFFVLFSSESTSRIKNFSAYLKVFYGGLKYSELKGG